MTTVYFVRHAQSDATIHDDRTRPLTEAGLKDSHLVTACLSSRGISHILSSPYLRTIQTVTALERAIERYRGQTIAIATHGTALSTILNHYDKSIGYQNFMRILDVMPYVVRLDFVEDGRCVKLQEVLLVQKQWRKVK